MKKIFVLFLLVIGSFEMTGCAMKQQSSSANTVTIENSFANQLGNAPVNAPIVIEQSPYGQNVDFIVGNLYQSGLGVDCRQVKVINSLEQIVFAVCKDANNKKTINWNVIPTVF